MKTLCVIPARYASSRLPGKPLAQIAGRPMIQWVYEQACKADEIDEVIVATDHPSIKEAVEKFHGRVEMTATELPSGTDRVYAAIKNEDADVIINLQGDEPFVSGELLNNLAGLFKNPDINIATPINKINNEEELKNPNIVKVVRDIRGFALYFSRTAIPFLRDANDSWVEQSQFYKHIGIYAYRKSCLKQLTQLKSSALEQAEKLEQLRFLENGFKIFTLLTDYDSISVDTEDDLRKVNALVARAQTHIKTG